MCLKLNSSLHLKLHWKFDADKELDIIEMAVYGNVVRPGKECRCRTVAEMLGQYKSEDHKAACKLPYGDEAS